MPNMPTATETKLIPEYSSRTPNVKRGVPVTSVLADRAEQQPEQDHRQRLDRRAACQGGRRDQPEDDEREELGRAERSATLASGGREQDEDERPDGAGEERADRGGREGRSGPARSAPSRGRRWR